MRATIIYRKKIKVSFGHLVKLIIAGYTRGLEVEFASREKKKAVFAHDSIGRHINLFGGYEREELDILFDFLSPLDVDFKNGLALDVGANIGSHAMYFSDHFQRVMAFEPNDDVFYLLKFNSNQCGNVTVEKIGLGDESGNFILQEVSGNMMASWIEKAPAETSKKKTYSIKVERLDDKNLDNVKFIKIDVEGFEINVLNGAAKTIEDQKPIILFEQHAKDFANDSSPSIQFLENLEYEICWLEGGRVLNSWFMQGLGAIKAFFLGYDQRIVFGGKVPVRTHSFLLAVPKESGLLKNLNNI